jgi:hypothetical protein
VGFAQGLGLQLAVEYATGSPVSSALYGMWLCDSNLGEGREQIPFRDTKNGEDVTAALIMIVAAFREAVNTLGEFALSHRSSFPQFDAETPLVCRRRSQSRMKYT